MNRIKNFLSNLRLPTAEYVFLHVPLAIFLIGLAYLLLVPLFTFQVTGKLDALVFPFVVMYGIVGVSCGLTGFVVLTQNFLDGVVNAYIRSGIRQKIKDVQGEQGDPTSPTRPEFDALYDKALRGDDSIDSDLDRLTRPFNYNGPDDDTSG